MSKTNEGDSKRSKGKKKSKREKGGIGEKPNVSDKSEKCSKISKSKVVKSENKPISSERKLGTLGDLKESCWSSRKKYNFRKYTDILR